jgi:hypothetical protein
MSHCEKKVEERKNRETWQLIKFVVLFVLTEEFSFLIIILFVRLDKK